MVLPIIASLFMLLATIKVWSKFRDKTLSLFESVLWTAIWVSIGIIFWQPEIASRLAVFVGIGRGADLIVYVSVIVIIYLLFRLFIRVDKMDRQLTKLVRTIALKDEKKDSDTNSQL